MTSQAVYTTSNGRRSKFTPEVRAKLLQALRLGNRYKTACQYAGVNYVTFRNWIIRGERLSMSSDEDLSDEDLDFLAFFEAVAEAEATSEMTAVAHWRSQMPADWKASRDFLARRYPEGWGAKVEVSVTHIDEQILALLEETNDDDDDKADAIEANVRELAAVNDA